MKIARFFCTDSNKSLTIFQHRDKNWYDIEIVLGPQCQYLYHWEENFKQLNQWVPDNHPPIVMDHSKLLPPFQPVSFRDFYSFEDHVKTARAKRNLDMNPLWYKIPVFYFSNPFSMIGHGANAMPPQGCEELDFELELGVVIGKAGKDIPASKAWEHIAGLTIINDLSARDLQRKEMSLQLGPSKAKDFATALGPYFITLDEFSSNIEKDILHLNMNAQLNGTKISKGNSHSMYHNWPKIIEHASRDVTLQPGELLGSGTVGSGCILELGADNTGGYLSAGDRIDLTIEKLGTLTTHIVERNSHA